MASIADILIAKGNAAAQGAQQRGNIYADLIRNLSSVPGQVVQQSRQREQDQLRQQAVDQQLQIGQMKLDEGRRTQQDRDMLRALLNDPEVIDPSTNRLNLPALTERARAQGGGHLMGELTDLSNHLNQSADAAEARIDAAKRRDREDLGVAATKVEASGGDQGLFQQMVTFYANPKRPGGALIPEADANRFLQMDDPAERARVLAYLKSGTAAGKTDYKAVAPGQPVIDFNNPQKGAVYTAPKDRKTVVVNGQVVDADTGERIGEPVPQQETHSPIYKEWQDYQKSGGTLDFNAYQNMDANRKRPVSITNAATTDAAITQAAKNILANPRDLTSIKTITSLRGEDRLQLFNKLKELDPTFNVGNIDRQIKFLDSYEDPKGRAATNRGSMNNILMHAADLDAVNEQYRRTNARVLNTPLAVLQRQLGTSWQQFATPLAVLKDEIALYFAGGYAPNAEQQRTWERIANDTATPAQIEQFAKDIIHVGLRRADTHNQQFKTMMGYDDPNLITPEAVQAGERLGMGADVKKYGSGGQIGQPSPARPTPTAPPPTPAAPTLSPGLQGLLNR